WPTSTTPRWIRKEICTSICTTTCSTCRRKTKCRSDAAQRWCPRRIRTAESTNGLPRQGGRAEGRRKNQRLHLNLLAAAIIGLVVAAGLAFTAWRPESRMEALLQNLGRQVTAERWEQAEATLRTVEEEWHKRRTWLLLNNSRNAVLRFEEQLARVR